MSLVAILRLLLTRVRAGTRVWSGNPSKPDVLHNTPSDLHVRRIGMDPWLAHTFTLPTRLRSTVQKETDLWRIIIILVITACPLGLRLVEKIAKYQSAGKVHSVHKYYCSLCQINHQTMLDSHSYLLMHTTISISVTTGPVGHNLFTDRSPRVLFVLSLWSVTGYALQRLCSSLFITRTCDFEEFTRGYVPQQNA